MGKMKNEDLKRNKSGSFLFHFLRMFLGFLMRLMEY